MWKLNNMLLNNSLKKSKNKWLETRENKNTDFPGVLTVKNPPASAGSCVDPWSGGIPHTVEQPTQCATLLKPARLGPELHQRNCCNEKPGQLGEQPPLAKTRESPWTAMETWCSLKMYTLKKKIQILWDAAKAVLRGEVIAIPSYLRKQEKSQWNDLTLHIKQTRGRKTNKTQS